MCSFLFFAVCCLPHHGSSCLYRPYEGWLANNLLLEPPALPCHGLSGSLGQRQPMSCGHLQLIRLCLAWDPQVGGGLVQYLSNPLPWRLRGKGELATLSHFTFFPWGPGWQHWCWERAGEWVCPPPGSMGTSAQHCTPGSPIRPCGFSSVPLPQPIWQWGQTNLELTSSCH